MEQKQFCDSRIRLTYSVLWCLPTQLLPCHLEDFFRGSDNPLSHASAIFQRRGWDTRSSRILAFDGVFPPRDVHSSKQDPIMDNSMDWPPDAKYGLPSCFDSCSSWLGGWSRSRSSYL